MKKMKLKYILIAIVLAAVVGIVVTKNSLPDDIVGNTPEEKAPIVAENPAGEADPKRMKLDMTEWRWVSALYNDGRELKPKTFGDFAITFRKDGRFTAKTDCNSMGGSYEVKDNLITFSNIFSTKMFCEGSQEGDFAKILENTASFFFTSRGELILELKFDSGTATFR